MSNNKAPYRYDVIGSFLRPEYLKKAREDYRSGSISADDLKGTRRQGYKGTDRKAGRAWL